MPAKRQAVTYLKNHYEISERRACPVLSIHRSSYRHQGKPDIGRVDQEVIRLSHRHSYWGYRKIYELLDRERFPAGRERVRLIRRREGLQIGLLRLT